MSQKNDSNDHLITSLIAGGFAEFSVDLALYPLDTIKTRIQSKDGFIKSGGFARIYSGLCSALIGSIPTASVFFFSYETTKCLLKDRLSPSYDFLIHMAGASVGEVSACLIRVPVEVIKQRSQANQKSSLYNMKQTYCEYGLRGFYRGYLTTVLREIPFAFIQYPLWEFLKKQACIIRNSEKINKGDALICGAIAGALASFLTTPFDVAKTRIILAKKTDLEVYAEKGIKGLFSGAVPRVLWISIGGAIFLGGYDISKQILDSKLFPQP